MMGRFLDICMLILSFIVFPLCFSLFLSAAIHTQAHSILTLPYFSSHSLYPLLYNTFLFFLSLCVPHLRLSICLLCARWMKGVLFFLVCFKTSTVQQNYVL